MQLYASAARRCCCCLLTSQGRDGPLSCRHQHVPLPHPCTPARAVNECAHLARQAEQWLPGPGPEPVRAALLRWLHAFPLALMDHLREEESLESMVNGCVLCCCCAVLCCAVVWGYQVIKLDGFDWLARVLQEGAASPACKPAAAAVSGECSVLTAQRCCTRCPLPCRHKPACLLCCSQSFPASS